MRSNLRSRHSQPARLAIVALVAILGVLAPVNNAEAAASITADVDLEVVASGLSLAVDLAAPPGDDRLFVVEKVGRIRVIKNGNVLSTPFLDITGPVRSSANEQGLLGLAFPDDYAETGLFYVHYTSDAGSGDTAIAEYSVSANPDVADAGSGRILFTTNQPNTNHNGGGLQVGPDGYLYASLGDGGGGGDPGENGQNKSTFLGSILRLDPATGDAAPGNPFIGVTGADEIWAWGLRNPWRFSFDRANGDMFIADVGQGALEEVDIAPAGVGGLNFGWNTFEGNNCFDPPCDRSGKTFPVHEYAHRSGGNCGGSITGGYVYRGNELPWLRGHYFYADWCHGDLKSFRMKGDKAVQKTNWSTILGAPGFITAFGEDGFGELYMLAQGNVYKFVSEKGPECDFNGDGYADVAVGSPGESHSGYDQPGRVVVFPGRDGGFETATNVAFRQGAGGVADQPEQEDEFGGALACGNFDGDAYGDLAIGAVGDEGVHVLYGSSSGLDGAGSDFWTQAGLGVGAFAADSFGAAIASGDLNRDGYDELVVGAPSDNEAGAAGSGSVTAIFGSAQGLTSDGAKLFHQSSSGIKGDAEAGDQMGYGVAVGDIDGDGFADIVAGIPGEGVGQFNGAGAIAVIYGKALGVGPRDDLIHRDSPGIKGDASNNSRFGIAVATGTFDNDGFDDIAVGIDRTDRAGGVHAIYGGRNGVSQRDTVFRQGAGGIVGIREAGDEFGAVLAAGDADGDGFDELAVGAPGEKHSGKDNAGMAGVIPGTVAGLDAGAYVPWHQSITGVKGIAQPNDRFGQALRFVDYRGDGMDDLFIGVPQLSSGGEVNWLPGRANGLTEVGDKRFDQDSPGVAGSSEPDDRFGGAL